MSLLDTASLIVTPNGYKEGKLYSVIPSDGSGDLSVTRATTATRVNSQGLVELVPYNLVQYSQEFDNAVWILENATITVNASTAPNGTMTADKLAEDSSLNKHDVYYGNNSGNGTIVSSGNLYTISIYAKAAERDFMQIAFGTGQVSGNPRVNFNISTGVVSAVDNGITATIENVGNGWYRCVASVTAATGFLTFVAQTQTSGTATRFATYTGTTGSGIYIWGAQLVEGSVAKDYQKTETRLNIPRLDYSNGTCPSILVEPQRTNLTTYSEDFSNSAWTKTALTISVNATTAPNGNLTADKINEDSSNNFHVTNFANGITPSGTNTLSVYAKAGERQWIWVYLFDGVAGSLFAWFDVANGTIGTVQSGLTANIEDAGNGWYRCSVTRTQANSGNGGFGLATADNVLSYTGTTGSGIYLWGAQLEAGSYPTSYIPTTSASVTRNADVISKTGISSLIGQTEGTFFCEIENWQTQLDKVILALSDGSLTNYLQVSSNSVTGNLQSVMFTGGSAGVLGSITPTIGQNYKIAVAYKVNDYALYINGSLIGTLTSQAAPSSLTRFDIGSIEFLASNYQPRTPYKSAALWKTRLSNTQLAQLTTI